MAKESNLAMLYEDITLAVLAPATKAATVVASKADGSRQNGYRIMKTEWMMQYEGKTTGEGPIIWGFAMGLTAAEVAAALTADPQSSTDDRNAGETERPIWPLGLIDENSVESGDNAATAAPLQLNGTFNPKWSQPEAQQFIWWAWNMSTGTLTTGLVLRIFAKHFGVWLRD